MQKKFSIFFTLMTTAILAIGMVSCGPDAATKELMQQANVFFKPLPAKMPVFGDAPKDQIALGEKLYHDVRLSVNDTQSCNTCHRLDEKLGGVDNKKLSDGALPGTIGSRNSPTVLNAGFHFVQFWDGRAADLAEQAKGPILNPVEMGMPSEDAVVKKIGGIDEYQSMFKNAFPDDESPITYNNLVHAIATFEATLITSDRFDDFLQGDAKALNDAEKAGLKKFMEVGCTTCHSGPAVGGSMYQKLGLVHPYANRRDLGRYDATGKEADKYFFKVPSLRNIALTAPYFHDGSIASLEEAVKQMAYLQLGKELTDDEVASIVTFLHTLTDKERVSK